MTLAELWLERRAHHGRVRDVLERQLQQAWFNAAVVRDEKGRLKDVQHFRRQLFRDVQTKPRSAHQLRGALRMLSRQYGYPLKRGGKVIH